MFMNILVGVMAAIAILAGVWGFWVDHRTVSYTHLTLPTNSRV